ncbi:hypothetical protein [Streptomyces sp. NPDC051776]|uniref:hypothetical protein n=1 Tax=Streptomyces sp. NPDC051776 TaxID=3155414 RepID=UPI0034291DF9
MTIMDTALRDALRTLKLSGMLETLDARLAQAHGGELGHLEFLQTLCQDEITRRDTVAFQRRLHRAKFDRPSPWRSSTSPPPRSCPPPRSATSPRYVGCTPESP